MTGVVKMVAHDRHFGFVTADDGSDWYVRKTDVGELQKGDRVELRGARLSDDRTFALDIVKHDATLRAREAHEDGIEAED